MKQAYLCPICQQPLAFAQNRYCCANHHSFDQAKEGYVNLLPVQFKHSKEPGDNKAMVNARRAFLEQGYYQPLAERLVSLYQQFANTQGLMLDAGCGEGYYTAQHNAINNQVFGIDIAKEAIKKAAKKYQQCQFSVGTLSHLPFADENIHWLLSIYAPILEAEFTRVLTKGGYLLTVTPAKKHLHELKALIYQNTLEHDEQRQPIKALSLVHQETLHYQMTLKTGIDTLNLLSMTPFAFKASEQVKQQLAANHHFDCQVDFLIRLYRKE